MKRIKELIKTFINHLLYKCSDWKLKRIIKLKIKCGYIEPDGTPIKCIHCDSTDLEEFNEYYLDGYGSTLIEYSVRCKKCDKTAGHWLMDTGKCIKRN